MPLDHFSIQVPQDKFENVVKFLLTSLEHLGFKEHFRFGPGVIGMGDDSPFLWFGAAEPKNYDAKGLEESLKNTHIAFGAKNREQVDQFHAAALKAGGIDNGAPGLRPNYHPSYYGAFVRDPDCGINWEVVCHCPEPKD